MQQIVINYPRQSQLTKARYSKLRTRKVDWKTVCPGLFANCKAMQLRLSHTLHPADDSVAYMSNFLQVNALIRNLKDQVTCQLPTKRALH